MKKKGKFKCLNIKVAIENRKKKIKSMFLSGSVLSYPFEKL